MSVDLTLPVGASADFYSAVAQVLPIFLLVMLVGEARMGVIEGDAPPSLLWLRLVVYVLNAAIVIAGEIAALLALANGPTFALHLLVCGAIASSAAYLLGAFLWAVLRDHQEYFSERARVRHGRIVMAVVPPTMLIVYLVLVFSTK